MFVDRTYLKSNPVGSRIVYESSWKVIPAIVGYAFIVNIRSDPGNLRFKMHGVLPSRSTQVKSRYVVPQKGHLIAFGSFPCPQFTQFVLLM